MPKLGSILVLLLFVPLAGAQAPKLDPHDPLDAVLMRWEKTMAGTDSFLIKNCVRTEKDKTGTKTYQGEIRFLKPGYFALKMVQTNNPHLYELFVCTGNRLYDYRPQSKRLVIHELDPIKAGAVNSMQKFFLGMTAAGIKRQFETSLQTNAPGSNAEFVWVELKPRFPEDKRAFSRVQVVLVANTLLPRRLTIEQPNGSQVIWDLPNVDVETKLKPADFTPPNPPAGWETQTAPRSEPRRP